MLYEVITEVVPIAGDGTGPGTPLLRLDGNVRPVGGVAVDGDVEVARGELPDARVELADRPGEARGQPGRQDGADQEDSYNFV